MSGPAKSPPDRVFVSWCSHCGQVGCAVVPGGRAKLTGSCEFCIADHKRVPVRYQLAVRRGTKRTAKIGKAR